MLEGNLDGRRASVGLRVRSGVVTGKRKRGKGGGETHPFHHRIENGCCDSRRGVHSYRLVGNLVYTSVSPEWKVGFGERELELDGTYMCRNDGGEGLEVLLVTLYKSLHLAWTKNREAMSLPSRFG
jgi:hypothetical protein